MNLCILRTVHPAIETYRDYPSIHYLHSRPEDFRRRRICPEMCEHTYCETNKKARRHLSHCMSLTRWIGDYCY